MEVYEYLDQVEKQIRQEAVRKEIRIELGQHIEDQADFYQESGMSWETRWRRECSWIWSISLSWIRN